MRLIAYEQDRGCATASRPTAIYVRHATRTATRHGHHGSLLRHHDREPAVPRPAPPADRRRRRIGGGRAPAPGDGQRPGTLRLERGAADLVEARLRRVDGEEP